MQTALITQPTLVLNKNWQPIGTSTVARSLVLVWKGVARIIDPADYQMYEWHDWTQLSPSSDEPVIKAVTMQIRVPTAITLSHYHKVPKGSVPFNRRNLIRRDHYTCQYCGSKPGSRELTIDHIVPRSKGGISTWENCTTACVACNRRKANKSLARSGMKIGKTPHRPTWSPLYSVGENRVESFRQFISAAYWNVGLEE